MEVTAQQAYSIMGVVGGLCIEQRWLNHFSLYIEES